MQISILTCLSIFFLIIIPHALPIQSLAPLGELEPVPAPEEGGEHSSRSYSPPAPSLPKTSPPAPAPAPVEWHRAGGDNEFNGSGDENSGEAGPPAVSSRSEMIKWCTVDEEVDDCEYLINHIGHSSNYTWICVKKDSIQECLEAMKEGEADLINLEAGLAFTAFLNYSLKAIANEVYCNHAWSYRSVAIVPRKSCQAKQSPTLIDFRGKKSCHGGYSTATGWNYPVEWIRKLAEKNRESNDEEIVNGFFSEVCAPSAFPGQGICGGCGIDGNENGTFCSKRSMEYYGDKGSLRCLMEGLGDIAFMREDTALLYSIEGPYNKSWSTKSIRDFMYLCPDGGCREINGYAGSCSFGTVPANVIMSRNSIPNDPRLFILEKLENVSLVESAYEAKIDSIHLLSPSTQELIKMRTLTRSYLGESALISQSILELNTAASDITASSTKSFSGASHPSSHCSNWCTILPLLLMSLYYY